VRAATALLAWLLLGGCVSTVQGTASPGEPRTTAASGAERAGEGRALEAHRIAAVTALVPAVFPDRTGPCPVFAGPFVTALALAESYFAYGTAADILDRRGFVAAWSECHSRVDDGSATVVAVIELSDPVSAALAAEEMVEGQARDGFEPVAVPGADLPALVRPDSDSESAQGFVPIDRLLVFAYHDTDAGHGVSEIAQLMSDQRALLEPFRPTPEDDVPELPADPYDLADRLVDPHGEPTPVTGPYDLEGAVRLVLDPLGERAMLTAGGLIGLHVTQARDELSARADRLNSVFLYAFAEPAGARSFHDAKVSSGAAQWTAVTLPDVPDATCFSFPAPVGFRQRCFLGSDRHVALLDTEGLDDPADVSTMTELARGQAALLD
jgi:hypothetical protein